VQLFIAVVFIVGCKGGPCGPPWYTSVTGWIVAILGVVLAVMGVLALIRRSQGR
jgi:hypothetical protein